MSDIKLLIDKKKTNEDKLVNVFLNYCGKYIRKIYNSLPEKKIFLKNLIDISYWNDSKKQREYEKFLMWCQKIVKVDEEELKYLLYTTLYLSIEIMIYNYEYIDFLNDIQFISTNHFFYNCMNAVSRFYYENFDKIAAPDKSKNELTEIISLQLHKAMPLKKIIKFIQESEEDNPFVIKYKKHNKQREMSDLSDERYSSDSSKSFNEKIKKLSVKKLNNSSTNSSTPKSSNKILKEKSSTESSAKSNGSTESSKSTESTERPKSTRSTERPKSTRSTERPKNAKSTETSERIKSTENSESSEPETSENEKLQYIKNDLKKLKYFSKIYDKKQKFENKEKYDDEIKHISLKSKKN